MMTPKEKAFRQAELDLDGIHAALKELLLQHPRGTVGKIQETLGVHDQYLRAQRHQGKLDLLVLLKVLRLLGMSPREFFFGVFGEKMVDLEELKQVSTTQDPVIERARKRWQKATPST